MPLSVNILKKEMPFKVFREVVFNHYITINLLSLSFVAISMCPHFLFHSFISHPNGLLRLSSLLQLLLLILLLPLFCATFEPVVLFPVMALSSEELMINKLCEQQLGGGVAEDDDDDDSERNTTPFFKVKTLLTLLVAAVVAAE